MSLTLDNKQASLTFGAKSTKSSTDGSVQVENFFLSFAPTVPSDTALFFHNKYAISGSGNQSIDLSGALTDLLGQSSVFTVVYGFCVINLNATPGDTIEVGNSNFAAWLGSATDKVVVGPTGCLFLFSGVGGYIVTASSADIFKIANPGSNSINVSVGILGK